MTRSPARSCLSSVLCCYFLDEDLDRPHSYLFG